MGRVTPLRIMVYHSQYIGFELLDTDTDTNSLEPHKENQNYTGSPNGPLKYSLTIPRKKKQVE